MLRFISYQNQARKSIERKSLTGSKNCNFWEAKVDLADLVNRVEFTSNNTSCFQTICPIFRNKLYVYKGSKENEVLWIVEFCLIIDIWGPKNEIVFLQNQKIWYLELAITI